MFHPIDTTEATPRHRQVYDALLGLIRAGQLKVGDKVPAELDLAAELGVSKLTIHRAVQALAAEGWVTRTVGRGTFVAERRPTSPLRRVLLAFGASTTNILGSDYYGSLYRGIAETLGSRVELALAPDAFGATDLPKSDGVLVIAPREQTHAQLHALHQAQPVSLVVGAHWPRLTLPSIDSDNQGAARQVAEHFAALGHQALLLISAEPETANTRDRIAGFCQAAQAQGQTVTQLAAKAFWRLSPEEKAALVDAVHDGVTAVFAAGYYLALDVLNALREAKLAVPDDVSVVGFDDPVSAQLVYPPLTTLRQPLYEMGCRAAQRMAALANQTDLGAQELLPAALILRSSTSPQKEQQR